VAEAVIEDIRRLVGEYGITRLCHFTPSRNLAHIARGGVGILATAALEADERRDFNPTDLARLDGHKSHISCSIEYPNAWYFDQAAAKDHLFTDWVVLGLDPAHLWRDDTLFCPYNASKGYGRGIQSGVDGFMALFTPSVREWRRNVLTPAWRPTDEQAEVLVADLIPMASIRSVIVSSLSQAKREAARLETLGVAPKNFNWTIAPTLFKKHELHAYLFRGERPPEESWTPW
jgi:hypothetical protein